ncbi:Spermidine/putrescine-binding periplasmic protein 2 [Halomicronema hongdechloris C2206]|uniref:Spermidine/putrescine-binding periplasmic protein 2 n=1 Tax=Halomicronema hongdechloris C2206 TaxID=1641165 RepID=A0A1Z3HGG3_9CYAN|nr:spermidine/putrescine ABC transporter substrate-binding protein [Halomicronema hongdechloris]ASC69400.1 Spermidine/putrescine-binding periplasmic protein 2 [Halomicronema hongdechloris C2206]
MPRRPRLSFHGSRRLSSTTRRRFLYGSAATVASLALANCRQNITNVQSEAPPSATPTGTGNGNDGKLYVYTWANYTDQALMDQFTEATGIEVVVNTYESNEAMLAKLQAGGGSNYSIVYPSDYMVIKMRNLELLTALDQDRLAGTNALLAKWQDPVYDRGNRYSVPFCWGTTGLLFNREALPTVPQDWEYLWQQQDVLSRRLTLLEDVRETLGAVLKSLGYSYNSTDSAELEAAFNRLMELKPHIASFKTSGFETELLGGDLLMVMSYSSDAIAATLEDERFEYIVPASGSSVWTDTMAIPTTAPNVDAAYEWINFILQPQVCKDAVERLFFATANQSAYDQLSPELKNNQDLFPPAEVVDKCEGIAPLPNEVLETYDRYWTEITSA